MSVLRGRLRDNVVHFKTVKEAVGALGEGSVAAVLANRAELEGALAGDTRFTLDAAALPEMTISRWPLGLAVKAESPDLATALEGAMAELVRDGTIAAIFKRFGATHLAP